MKVIEINLDERDLVDLKAGRVVSCDVEIEDKRIHVRLSHDLNTNSINTVESCGASDDSRLRR